MMMTVDTDLGGDVVRGLARLNKRQRSLHPRAQVQTLKKMAQRALTMRDWDAYADRRGELMMRAKDAMAAMQHLNREHNLGYGQ